MRIHPEVAEALAGRRPVVALESTIVAHGLPRTRNLAVAREIETSVREAGAVPATIAVVDGEVRVGLDDGALEAVARRDDVGKCGVRDLAVVCARGGMGATTVAATAHLAARAGIAVFATGGLGGVHRRPRGPAALQRRRGGALDTRSLAREVVVTSGADGATWTDGTGTEHVPAEPADVVVTTGAGDAFTAGLLVARLRSEPPHAALEAAVATATRALTQPGAGPA